jgi:iron complex transport system substrate-binding protein
MKFLSRLLTLIIVLTVLAGVPALAQDSGFPRTVTDGVGNPVTINARPVHIVSATLVSDEVLLSLVDPSRLTAVTANASDATQSNVADLAQAIPNKLASPLDPEAVVALKADLVIVSPFTDPGVVKQLKDAKQTVFMLVSPYSIKDIENNITLLGQAVGEEKRAAEIVDNMETKLKAIADAVKGVKNPLTVLYYAPDGYSDGPGTTIDEVITRAGGINAVTAGGIKDSFPQLNDEFVVKQDPDVILLAGFNNYSPGFVDKFNSNPNFQTLKAIKNKRVSVANDAHVASISQYIVEGVSDVAALLYPDVYKPAPAATASAAASATLEATEAK